MKSIEIMNEEHKYIMRMLKVVRKANINILQGLEISYDDFELIVEFISTYADDHHHKKEEKILFNKMVEELGEVADKVVRGGMLVEHDLGRLYIKDLREALEKVKSGDEEAKLDVIANAISYTHLLERHIDKEDRVIYKFAERELDADTLKIIDEECMKYEDSKIEVKKRALYILEELEKKYI